MARHHIGYFDEFEEGRGQQVTVSGIEIAVFNIDGDLYGIQNLCPHKRLPLHLAGSEVYQGDSAESTEGDGNTNTTRGRVNGEKLSVSCPWHWLEWDLETGNNPVIDVDLPTYDVEVDGDEVYIEI